MTTVSNPTKQKQHYAHASRMRKKRLFLRRIFLIGLVIFIPALAGLSLWLHKSGYIAQGKQQLAQWGTQFSVYSGLTVQDVYLEGQQYTSTKDILHALNVDIGEPLFAVNITAIRKRLEQLNWVEYAVVSRQLPHTLHVSIVEYRPVAIWQNAGQFYLVNEQGQTIVPDDIKPFAKLMVLVGDDAPLYASHLLQMIYTYPKLAKRVNAAVRVGERRWNIRFDHGPEVKLPEENQEEAWKFLYELQRKHKILDDDRKTVDLRIPNKVYIRSNTPDEAIHEQKS